MCKVQAACSRNAKIAAVISRRAVGLGLLGASVLEVKGAARRRCVVVGSGVFGSWTAYHLRKAGHDVTLVDAWGPGNSRSSSGGETRIIRASYGPDEVYSRMAQAALPQWEALAQTAHRPLFLKTGVLWLHKPELEYARQSKATLGKLGIALEELSTGDLASRYPQIQLAPGTVAQLEVNSGALMARQAVAAVVSEFVRAGGKWQQAVVAPQTLAGPLHSLSLSTGDTVTADEFIFACGPWLPKVFPEVMGGRLFVTRQEVLFFGTPAGDPRFAPQRMPVWIDFSDDRNMYGFPDIEHRGFKVAFDAHGPAFDPDTGQRVVSAEKIAEARVYLRDRFPALANMPVIESRVCQYENSSNGDFLIDRHPAAPNVWLVGGGSGHGFKHGPSVGAYAAARVLGAAAPAIEPRFSLATKTDRQQRAVK